MRNACFLIFLTIVFIDSENICQEYFIGPENNREIFCLHSGQRIQKAESLRDKATRDRELRALETALEGLSLKEGLILTDSGEDYFFGRPGLWCGAGTKRAGHNSFPMWGQMAFR